MIADAPSNWLVHGLMVRDALQTGAWKKTAETSTQWLVGRAEETKLSAQTLRRFATMADFAERLAQNGMLPRAADAGNLSLAKLEVVAKIWELSPVQGAKAVRSMIESSTETPTLRGLRKLYSQLAETTEKALEARKTGRKSAQSGVVNALREFCRLNDVIGEDRKLASPGSRLYPYVTVDGIIVRFNRAKEHRAEEAVLVVRPREIANRTALLPLLAQCFWAATFFDRLWVIGRAKDFPVGISPRQEPLLSTASLKNEIDRFVFHLGKCGGTNIGVVEILDGAPKILRTPEAGPVPDRRLMVDWPLKPESLTFLQSAP